MSCMAVVIASDLGKDIAGEPLLRGISFKLERRDRMTLSGRNGTGKTTLLRMLAGEATDRRRRARVRQGRQGRAARPAPAARARCRCATTCCPVPRSWSRSSPSWRRSSRRWRMATYDEATLDRYARAQARLEHAGGYNWRERALPTLHGLGFRDDARPRPAAAHVLGRRAHARVARAGARRRPGPAAARRADQPSRHRVARVARGSTSSRSTPRSCWSRTTAGSWRRSAPRCSSSRPGRGRFFAGPWHAWRKEKAARDLALGRAIERQQAEIDRLERFVTRFRAGTRARQAQSRAKSWTRSSGCRAIRPTARRGSSRSRRPSAAAG